MVERIVKAGIIGLGARAETLLATILEMDEVQITSVCDFSQERIDKILGIFDKHGRPRPTAYSDYHQMLEDKELEALFVPTSWNSHLRIAIDCMNAGKNVGIEVGGAASIDELWQLVHASESTGVSCMMLENTCYCRDELMVLNMVRQGLFGELIYCEGGYEHGIGDELAYGYNSKLERTFHNMHRNGDLYPTHAIGPIAKILDINRGNRFLTLSSHATKSRGMALAMKKYIGKEGVPFLEGDVVTTIIHCANGENITLTHGVSLPRPYSRNQRIQGTKGIWLHNAKGIYIDGISVCKEVIDIAGNPYLSYEWDPVDSFYEKYDHPIWQEYRNNILGGHGGVDALTIRAFLDSVRKKTATPIDVYDCAAWMSVTCLSEQSVALGGMPVPFPDFTNGRWINREPKPDSIWAL
ncbi:MAG: Gfo/Idh/MocA family oxidoreductase [Victivallales bacterium]|nr:Gfo/Idh/MocA family oxidoreductase [Victivallales bacterium]